MPKTLIGWNENVDLPDWGVKRLGAKIDTGARTSALHVEDLEVLPQGRIRFRVVVHRELRDRHVLVVSRIARRSRVKSSNGQFERRYFVKTTLRLGGIEKEIEISLVDRGKMLHRMLLGRTALKSDFLVDVSRRNLMDKPLEERREVKVVKKSRASDASKKSAKKTALKKTIRSKTRGASIH